MPDKNEPTIVFSSRSGIHPHRAEHLPEGYELFRAPGGRAVRHALSNFAPIEVSSETASFASAEHYFHALKAEFFGCEKIARSLALGGLAGGDPPNALKKYTGKRAIFAGDRLEAWDKEGSRAALIKAVTAKFRQNPVFRSQVRLTRGARLVHPVMQRGKKTRLQRWVFLEALRDEED